MWTIDQFIAGISGAATLATAVATFLTVREIAKQRMEARKPELISVHQYAYAYSKGPHSFNFLWAKDRAIDAQAIQNSRYTISVLNVGAGAAKQLRSEWVVDLTSMITQINDLARQTSTPLSVDLAKEPSGENLRILWPDKTTETHLVTNQLTCDCGHILPTSLDKIGLQLEVPPVLLTLISMQVALCLAAQQNFSDLRKGFTSLPQASLLLTYTDIGEELHMKRLRLILDPLSAGHEKIAYHPGESPTFMQFAVRVDEDTTAQRASL